MSGDSQEHESDDSEDESEHSLGPFCGSVDQVASRLASWRTQAADFDGVFDVVRVCADQLETGVVDLLASQVALGVGAVALDEPHVGVVEFVLDPLDRVDVGNHLALGRGQRLLTDDEEDDESDDDGQDDPDDCEYDHEFDQGEAPSLALDLSEV